MSTASSRVLALVAAAVVLAGCGSSGGGAATATTAASSAGGPAVGGVAAAGGELAFPKPPDERTPALVSAAGLTMEPHESLQHHVHAHLDVFIDGAHRTIPGGIGIVTSNPGVKTGQVDGQPAFGGIANCDPPCISPLHTHDVTGVLHTESATSTDNTLGEFFGEWGVPLDPNCVGTYCQPATPIAVYVNGKPVPLASAPGIKLTDHEEIALVIGTPPARIPSSGDFSAA